MAIIRARMILLVAIALFTVIPQAYSQIAGSMDETTGTDMGGRNFIVGTVYGPSGQPVNARIRVRLASLRFREVMTSTDDYGKFAFSGLGAGTYTVNVDEDPDYEAVSQQVELQRGPDSYNVSLRLTFKKNAPGRASIFRTENAGVPQKALDLYYKANDLAKAGDRAGAIEQLKLAVAAYPRFMLALTEIGVQYLILGDLAKADEALIAALKIKPGTFEPLVNRGIVYFRLHRFVEAEGLLRAAIKAKEQSGVARYYLGRTLMSVQKFDEAQTEFIAAIAANEAEAKEAHRMLALLYLAKKENSSAAAELRTYLKLNPQVRDADQLRSALKQLEEAPPQSSTPEKP